MDLLYTIYDRAKEVKNPAYDITIRRYNRTYIITVRAIESKYVTTFNKICKDIYNEIDLMGYIDNENDELEIIESTINNLTFGYATLTSYNEDLIKMFQHFVTVDLNKYEHLEKCLLLKQEG